MPKIPAPLDPASQARSPSLRLLPTAAIVLFGFLSVGIPLPVLPVHVHDALGFGTVTVGVTVGIQSVATVLTRGFAGRVCDGRGPRPAVLMGLPAAMLAGLAYLLSVAVPDPAWSLAVIVVGRCLTGFAESLFLTGTMTWALGRVGVAHSGTAMGWQGLALYGALSLGAPVGVWVAGAYGFAGIGVATILAPLAAVGVALRLPGVAPTGGAGRGMSFLEGLALVRRQGFALALASAPFAGLSAFVALDYGGRGWSGAGLALTGFGLGFMAVRLAFSHLPDRLGGRPVAIASLLVEGAGQILMWAAPNAPLSILGAAVTGAGASLVFPALGVEVMRRAPPESRGLAFGAFVAFLDAAIAVTGPLLGALVAGTGYRAIYAAGAAACAAGLAVVLLPRRGER